MLLSRVEMKPSDLFEHIPRHHHPSKPEQKPPGMAHQPSAYLDELMEYEEYRRQKRQLEGRLTTLVVPGTDAAEQVGRLLEDLPDLWEKADLSERRRILTTMLEAVYVECKKERRIVGIRPKPTFRPLFQIATTRADSGVVLVNPDIQFGEASPLTEDATETGSCLWWRRGRVELGLKHGLAVLVVISWLKNPGFTTRN